jgi:hypothetical protein
MTTRERFANIMRFQPVDRLPRMEWATWWDKTITRWESEGLAVPPHPYLPKNEALQQHLGLDLHLQVWIGFFTPQTPRAPGHGLPIIANNDDYTRILPTLYPEHLPVRRTAGRLPAVSIIRRGHLLGHGGRPLLGPAHAAGH